MINADTRYDGDSWVLATSVGATATAVAASRAIASQGPDVPDDPVLSRRDERAAGLDTRLTATLN